jgi:hypothetical protein
MVAAHWFEPGPYLYGPQWVDRPPALIALFDVADHLGPYGVRLTATVLAVVLVAAVADAAHVLGGRPAAACAAWCAFAFVSSVLLGAEELNGELAAATFVAMSVALLVRALHAPRGTTRSLLLGAVAGGSAAAAELMKQDFVDALAFATVLLVGAAASRRTRSVYRPAIVGAAALGFVVGVIAVATAALAWASGHGGLAALGYAMFGFRSDAARVIANWSWAAPERRLIELVQVSVLTGLSVLLLYLALGHARRLRSLGPLEWALGAAIGVELFGIVGGENFWTHYLIALVPTVALAAGLSANRRIPGWRLTRGLVVVSAAITAVVSPASAFASAHQPSQAYTVGRWVATAAEPTDSIVVPFSHANAVQASGLRPGYPYSWSLPVRTLDPGLSLLTATLSGPAAPTWVVRWDAPHLWGLDPKGDVDEALHDHYRLAATVCGHAVWLHDGLTRPSPPPPPASQCR